MTGFSTKINIFFLYITINYYWKHKQLFCTTIFLLIVSLFIPHIELVIGMVIKKSRTAWGVQNPEIYKIFFLSRSVTYIQTNKKVGGVWTVWFGIFDIFLGPIESMLSVFLEHHFGIGDHTVFRQSAFFDDHEYLWLKASD